MTWIDFAWPAMGAASLTLGVIHLLIWARQPALLPRLFLGLTAASVFFVALLENQLIHATSPAEYGLLLRWMHLPIAILLIGMCAFVHWQFPHTSRRLFLLAAGGRVAVVAVNFLSEPNINFVRIDRLEHVPALGLGQMPIPVGELSPWGALGQLSVLLMLGFLAHALFSGWRAAGPLERSQRLRMIGTLLGYLALMNFWRLAVLLGWVAPMDVMVPGFVFVIAMVSYELASDVLRNRELELGRDRAEREAALHRIELEHLSRVALLSALSGSLAHELNQPLTAILSNAQAAQMFLRREPPDLQEVSEILDNIIESDKRAGDVIQRLRAMMRKDTGDFRRLDANVLVDDVLRLVRSDLIERDIGHALALAADLPPVLGEPVPLQQVLLNLVINACDAMAALPPERRRLRIRSARLPDGGVLVSVADSGCGIPDADLERIFEPFVTSKRDGLGLGLSVCATIVGAHGGRLWAENNPDVGATVHVALPAAI